MLTLSIPQRRDPIARGALLFAVAAVIYAVFASGAAAPAAAQADPPIILVATPALPTAAPGLALSAPIVLPPTAIPEPTAAPAAAVELAAPTIEPQIVERQVDQPPQVVYVPVAADPPPPVVLSVDSAQFQQSVSEAYQSLPTVQCPCGPSASNEAAAQAYQQRRLDAGSAPRTR